MLRLRDVVKPKKVLEGDKRDIDSILDKELSFTDWDIRPSKVDTGHDYMILQYVEDEKKYVVMTGSGVLIDLVREFESSEGKKPFLAKIIKKKKYYTFE